MDPVGLQAAQRRRDAEADAAADGKDAPAAAKSPAKPAIDFTRPGPAPTAEQKARGASRLAELLKARKAREAEYAEAWDKP